MPNEILEQQLQINTISTALVHIITAHSPSLRMILKYCYKLFNFRQMRCCFGYCINNTVSLSFFEHAQSIQTADR